jgi:D-alanine transaminase
MSEPLVYLNGEFVNYSEAKIPVEDRSIQFGDSVYEVIRYYGGRPFRIEQHMRRMQRSAGGIQMPIPPVDELGTAANELVRRQALSNCTVYIQVTRGVAARLHGLPEIPRQTVIAIARPAEVVRPKPPITCITLSDDRWARPYMKTAMLLPNATARETASRLGADDAILVRDGFLTEATASNVFIILGSKLVTPPLSNYILPGITREAILEMAQVAGIDCDERPVPMDELYQADGIFLTGTNSELPAVVRLDNRQVADGRPPALFEQVAKLYDEAAIGVAAGR